MKIARLMPSRGDFAPRHLRHDLLAGLTVAVVALPLALGFGVTTGAGAAAGIATAIVAGFVAAVFGGSNFQVSGPTGAMTVVLLPIVARYGVGALATVGVVAGVVLVALSLAGVGRYVHYIPWPVIAGFTTGIAVIIFLQQAPGLLGVEKVDGEGILPVTWRTLERYLDDPGVVSLVLGAITVIVMVGWMRIPRIREIPASMAALLLGTFVSLMPAFDGVARVAGVPRGLPSPTLPAFDLVPFADLVRVGLTVAVLAALESLLSAVVADGMTIEERHDPDRELLGQGLANVASSLFGGMPATGALARTAVNLRSGARTRVAAAFHAVVLLAVVSFLAPLATRIPLAVLAGILMVVAWRMVESESVRTIFRATRADAIVFALTMAVTILVDLIMAIEVGLVAAGFLFVVRMGGLLSIDPQPLAGIPSAGHDTPTEVAEEEGLRSESIVAYRIDGPVFFGAANRFFDQLLKVGDAAKVVILRMRRVPVMDATGLAALEALVDRLRRRGILVLVSGLQDQPYSVLERTGVLDAISRSRDHLFGTTEEAIEHARLHLSSPDHLAPAAGGTD
jgi:SulP family sulfate permease